VNPVKLGSTTVVTPRPEENDFDAVLAAAMSRRDILKSIFVVGGMAAIGGVSALPRMASALDSRFAFSPIDANSLDAITLPEGYIHEVVVRWGDPLWSDAAEFDHGTRGTGASQEKAFGDNIDGMEVFPIGDRLVLVVNNEYTNRSIIWGNREDGAASEDDDVLKGKMAHGLTVVEIARGQSGWQIVKDSPFNRRVTPDTPMALTGPAAGDELVKTAADPEGKLSLGTWNNIKAPQRAQSSRVRG